jgi:SWI/SNF-related matrix-associated actin-dependent regulator of chromatin subfamily A3
VRIAVSLLRVAAEDIPATARAALAEAPDSSAPGPSQKKRKAAYEAAFGTQPPVPQPNLPQTQAHAKAPASQARSQAGAAGGKSVTVVADEEDEVEEVIADDQPIEELYVTLRTKIVGVQYYSGVYRADMVLYAVICAVY